MKQNAKFKSSSIRIDKLETRLMSLKLKMLEIRVKEIEETLHLFDKSSNLENLTDNQLKSLFVDTILSKYGRLIDMLCQQMERKINQPYLDKDELKQESIEYLLRFCYPKVITLSKNGKIWIPYLRRSLYNCYVNLQKKHQAKIRQATVVELTPTIEDTSVDESMDVQAIYEYQELVNNVLSKLDGLSNQILKDLLNPPLSLRTYITLYRIAHKPKSYSPRKVLANYYDVPLSTINSCFYKIKRTINFYQLSTA